MDTNSSLRNLSSPSCLISDDASECETLIIVRKVSASFSFIGCVFMILVIWLFKKYIVFAQRLILYLTIGALMDCISYFMSNTIEDGPLCNFQAFWLTYFDWTVLLWVSVLTFNLYMNVIFTKPTENYEKIYHVVCWGLPMLFSLLPFIKDHYGPAGAWCWITEDIAWRLTIWYVPLFATIFFMFFAYLHIHWTLTRQASVWQGNRDPETERIHRMLKEDIKPLRFYPFVYLLVSVFPLANRICNAFGKNYFWLLVAASVCVPLHGVCNAIVFGLDKETRQKLTFSQMQMAWLARSHQQEVREYPLAFGQVEPLEAATPDSSKFRNVAYSRLH